MSRFSPVRSRFLPLHQRTIGYTPAINRRCTSMARTNPHDGKLLSLPDCRRLLGPVGDSLSDAEVVRLRDQLYALAQCTVAAFERDACDEQESTVLGYLAPDAREEVEERAAILQFDARLPRGLATRAAVAARVNAVKKGR